MFGLKSYLPKQISQFRSAKIHIASLINDPLNPLGTSPDPHDVSGSENHIYSYRRGRSDVVVSNFGSLICGNQCHNLSGRGVPPPP